MSDNRELKFVLLGGFLGAGKTTTIARLTRNYQAQGLRVGLVTNDQADDLVDTSSLKQQGFSVEEVAGACFCCRFDELVERVDRLGERERPNVILAEPVGSCTDLVATVIQPLRSLYSNRFRVAPYAVLFKPSHGLRILGGADQGGFSPKAAYIFHKQLEEADAIVINRIDEMSPPKLDQLARLVAGQFPDTPLLRMSARTGEGMEHLESLLAAEGDFGRKILDIDYDVYAEGEAELGWLNCRASVSSAEPFAMDELLLAVVRHLQESLVRQRAEVAHLKVIGLGEQSFGVSNLVSSQTEPELSLPSRQSTREAEVVVNARVAIDPDLLAGFTRTAIEAASAAHGATARLLTSRHLRPGRPTPTHRYAAAVS